MDWSLSNNFEWNMLFIIFFIFIILLNLEDKRSSFIYSNTWIQDLDYEFNCKFKLQNEYLNSENSNIFIHLKHYNF